MQSRLLAFAYAFCKEIIGLRRAHVGWGDALNHGRWILARGHRLKWIERSDLRSLKHCGNRPPHFGYKLIKMGSKKERLYCEVLCLEAGRYKMFAKENKIFEFAKLKK